MTFWTMAISQMLDLVACYVEGTFEAGNVAPALEMRWRSALKRRPLAVPLSVLPHGSQPCVAFDIGRCPNSAAPYPNSIN